jgi:hypothetical protein
LVRCMLKSLTLVVHRLDPVLYSLQLVSSLQSPEHCEQLAAVYQVTEASLRTVWQALTDPPCQSVQDAATDQVMTLFSGVTATSFVQHLMELLVPMSSWMLLRWTPLTAQAAAAAARQSPTAAAAVCRGPTAAAACKWS